MLRNAARCCDGLYHAHQLPPFFILSPTCLESTLYSTTNSDNTTMPIPRSSRHGQPQPSLNATVATRAMRPDADVFSAPESMEMLRRGGPKSRNLFAESKFCRPLVQPLICVCGVCTAGRLGRSLCTHRARPTQILVRSLDDSHTQLALLRTVALELKE